MRLGRDDEVYLANGSACALYCQRGHVHMGRANISSRNRERGAGGIGR